MVVCMGGMRHFIKINEHTYRDLTSEFLSTLHVEITCGPQCQAGYIFFYLQGKFYELNLGTFNSIFAFPPSMVLPNRQVPREFNPNAFWGELLLNVRYSTSSSKCTHIQNPYIRVAQRILVCCFFTQDDNLNIPSLSELYFLSCMLNGAQLDPEAFLVGQLYSATVNAKSMIAIGDIVTTIARFLGVESNPDDRVSRSERLDQDTFELMNFCKVEAIRLCWIYPGDRLLPLRNGDRTTLLHRANLYWVPGDAELFQSASPLPPFASQVGPSSSSQATPTNYADLQAILRSVQKEQISLRVYVASENAALRDFVQERHDELSGMLATQTHSFQDYKACLEIWHD